MSAIMEATASRFRVRVIQAGLSLNRNLYPEAVLRDAVPLFANARVFIKSDREHLNGAGKDVRNLIGRITEPVFVVGAGGGAIEAVLEPIDPEDPLIKRIAAAVASDMAGLFGLSIDADAEAEQTGTTRTVKRITAVRSVDLIVEPGAGGAVLNLLEAFGGPAMAPEIILAMVRQVEACSLPRPSKDRILEAFTGRPEFTQADLNAAIEREQSYVARLSPILNDAGKVSGLGRTRIVEAEEDKKRSMLDAFLDDKDKSVTSIRECYVELTGDRHITGRAPRGGRLTEALDSASFSEVLGDALQRRMLADYREMGVYDVWRDLANIVPVSDFREQHRTRFGGYGDLPTVAESAPYLPVTSPDDEAAIYQVAKRGGIETVTLEMIKNDDAASIQRIPVRMARAAKRTLSKFVLDFLRTNPAIFDGKALFHVDHGNLSTTSLGSASLAAARLAMKRQTEKSSGDRLAIPPRFLWVSDDLEEAAVDLFRRNTNNDANFTQSLPIQVRPVWYWSDVNDWCLSADKNDIPSVEIGFLDGKEEPEILIQDNPSVGSVFTNDVITYKIRHIYGAAVTDWRGLHKAVVA